MVTFRDRCLCASAPSEWTSCPQKQPIKQNKMTNRTGSTRDPCPKLNTPSLFNIALWRKELAHAKPATCTQGDTRQQSPYKGSVHRSFVGLVTAVPYGATESMRQCWFFSITISPCWSVEPKSLQNQDPKSRWKPWIYSDPWHRQTLLSSSCLKGTWIPSRKDHKIAVGPFISHRHQGDKHICASFLFSPPLSVCTLLQKLWHSAGYSIKVKSSLRYSTKGEYHKTAGSLVINCQPGGKTHSNNGQRALGRARVSTA